MYTAIEKRKENIAEYILYLWQLEDLLRALDFDPQAIRQSLVDPRGLEPTSADNLQAWYVELGALLVREGKEQTGHLDHTMHLIAELQTLHGRAMNIPEGAQYRALYARLEPSLENLRAVTEGSQRLDAARMGEIELFFRALYAAMLYRIRGEQKAQQATADVLELISPVVAELASLHHRAEMGQIDLFPEESDPRGY